MNLSVRYINVTQVPYDTPLAMRTGLPLTLSQWLWHHISCKYLKGLDATCISMWQSVNTSMLWTLRTIHAWNICTVYVNNKAKLEDEGKHYTNRPLFQVCKHIAVTRLVHNMMLAQDFVKWADILTFKRYVYVGINLDSIPVSM